MLALHNTSAQPRGLVFRSHLVLTLGAQNDQTMLATSIICIHMTSYVGISWLFWNMLDDLGKQIKLLQTLILHDFAWSCVSWQGGRSAQQFTPIWNLSAPCRHRLALISCALLAVDASAQLRSLTGMVSEPHGVAWYCTDLGLLWNIME